MKGSRRSAFLHRRLDARREHSADPGAGRPMDPGAGLPADPGPGLPMAALLRAVALLIALAAFVDPSLIVERRARPLIELHTAAGAEELAGQVAARLEHRFTVVPAPVANAAARVVVGDTVPPAAGLPGFVVTGDASGEQIAIVEVRAPARAPLNARVPVGVVLRPGAGLEPGAEIVVELHVDGLVADRQTISSPGSDANAGPSGSEGRSEPQGTSGSQGRSERQGPAGSPPRSAEVLAATLTFIPATPGPHHLRVVAGGAWADSLVTVQQDPWRVLVYDPRPSWSSTFVRRALERDPRFELSARVDTSPRSLVTSGSPPGLGDLEALGGIDVVIAGAPDALGAADTDALAAFMRRRGGSVVALIDGAPGAVADLAGTRGWEERLSPAPATLIGGGGEQWPRADGARAEDWRQAERQRAEDRQQADRQRTEDWQQAEDWLQASELAVVDPLPSGALVLAGIEATSGIDPVVWQLPVGAGRLVVSGALDAWRFRGAGSSRFDEFWRRVVANAAAAAPAAIELHAEPRVGRPGETVLLEVTLRDIALSAGTDAEARVSARLEGGAAPAAVRLWPAAPGRFHGRLRLPDEPGFYRWVVEAGEQRASATGDPAGEAVVRVSEAGDPARGAGALAREEARLYGEADLLVAGDAAAAAKSSPELLDAWASAHGGEVIPAARLDDLIVALETALLPDSITVSVRPMRSAWWIVPFALCLGAEWWLRRRRGAR